MNVLIISSSIRGGSNSETLAKAFMDGALDAGHNVELLSLKEKEIQFCKGCLSCQNTGKCIIHDDMDSMISKVNDADTLVFASPVYYYSIAGQLKTFLDRCNPLYIADYKFRDIYLIMTSTEDGEEVYDTSKACIKGWADCFPKARLTRVLTGGGVTNPREITFKTDIIDSAYELGKTL